MAKTFKLESPRLFADKALYRVVSTVDRPAYNVVKGDVGGWVAGEHNLNDDPNAWVGVGAAVIDEAFCDSHVFGAFTSHTDINCVVKGKAQVVGSAIVSGHAEVSGCAIVFDHAEVSGRAIVSDNAVIAGFAQVGWKAVVSGTALVTEDAEVRGCARVGGHVIVGGEVDLSGFEEVYGAEVGEGRRLELRTHQPLFVQLPTGERITGVRFDCGTVRAVCGDSRLTARREEPLITIGDSSNGWTFKVDGEQRLEPLAWRAINFIIESLKCL